MKELLNDGCEIKLLEFATLASIYSSKLFLDGVTIVKVVFILP